ncbi:MAG: CDP-alcohol phosphatidyltransferase family protein [Pseudomonadota bacterium]
MGRTWIPNAVTLLRIGAAPIAGGLVWWATVPEGASLGQAQLLYLAFWIFVVASLTDWLDGYLARALSATSALGAKLDLWADKILVFSVLVGMLPDNWVTGTLGLVCLTGRDIYIMRLRANRPDVSLKASLLAKTKTAIVMVGLAGILLGTAQIFEDIAQLGDVQTNASLILMAGFLLFAIGCLLSLYTGWQYVAAARRTPRPT